jgi:hypothetical protein
MTYSTKMPAKHLTVEWLVAGFGDRSFGVIPLVLALLSLLPGVSAVAGVLLMVPPAR